MSNIDWRFWKQQVIKGFIPQFLYERARGKKKREDTIYKIKSINKDLLDACKAVKLRIHFIGLPSEPMNEDGPDWSKEIALLEVAITKSKKG